VTQRGTRVIELAQVFRRGSGLGAQEAARNRASIGRPHRSRLRACRGSLSRSVAGGQTAKLRRRPVPWSSAAATWSASRASSPGPGSDTFVKEGNLRVHIAALRSALGDG